jgi:hypothetical protein
VTTIPAFKIDHSLTSKAKLSFYYSHNATGSQFSPTLGQSDGLPLPITAARGTFIESHIERLNFDYTLTPTLLLHVGAGYQHNDFKDTAPVTDYNALQQLGLRGTTLNRNFPCFQGLNASLGGVQNLGPCAGQSRSLFIKPTFNTSFTWVKNDHTYKAGAEFRTEGYPAQIFTNTYGNFQFSAAQTGLPSAALQGLQGGTVGYPYASFLLGLVNTATIAAPANPRIGKHQLGLFIQDTWKVTRRFTLDYGLRWDYSTYLQEQYGRFASFSPTTADPSAGGHPGAPVFEGSGPGHCNCNFSSNYPFAFGPRLGAAYQITRKTVLRAGFGIVYDGTSNGNGSAGLAASNVAINAPFPTSPAAVLAQGIPASPLWPNFNPGQYPFLAGAANNLLVLDRNAGRPARQYTWSIGVQRELATNLLVEASYVGSRGVWWQANNLTDINALTSDILGSYGLSLNSASDRQLLISPVNSAAAVARGFNNPPYAGFPSTATVAQSLRPFPQFGSIGNLWAPLGKTWYDSLQAKVTKRLSHGLDFTYTFTWQKSLALGAENEIAGALGVQPAVNDVFNRSLNKNISGYDQPFYGVLALNYTLPILKTNKALSRIVRDWTIAPLIQDASGLPIHVPYAQNQLNSVLLRASNNNAFGITPTFANRVPNVPLFSQDLNCHCFDSEQGFRVESGRLDRPGSWSVWHLGSLLWRLPVPAPSGGEPRGGTHLSIYGNNPPESSDRIYQHIQPNGGGEPDRHQCLGDPGTDPDRANRIRVRFYQHRNYLRPASAR